MPATALPPSGGGDADMTLIVAATARPSLDVPLVLDETAAYRKQATLSSYDMLSDALGGTLTFAARDYAQAAYTGYSGLEHTGIADVGWGGLSLGYVIDRDATSDSMLAATSQGLRAAARVHASSDIETRQVAATCRCEPMRQHSSPCRRASAP